MNKKIIEQFTYLIEDIKKNGHDVKDRYRIIQLKNALKIIENYPKKISDAKDLEGLPGIGKGVLERISEILKTGKLKEITSVKIKPKVIDELMDVINIGEKVAEKLVETYKIKSVSELIKKHNEGKIELNDKIIMGLKYYKKVEGKIPRKEVTAIVKIIRSAGKKIDKNLIVTPCGSYRRGNDTSNDIDILLSHQTEKKDYIHKLVKYLTNLEEPFLIDNLTEKGLTKYMGFCQFNGKVRRIDIRFVPFKSYYSALLYFTGNANLNKIMRSHAKKRKYLLNEYGLYKDSKLVPIESEKDIFDLLGMDYLEPNERNL